MFFINQLITDNKIILQFVHCYNIFKLSIVKTNIKSILEILLKLKFHELWVLKILKTNKNKKDLTSAFGQTQRHYLPILHL